MDLFPSLWNEQDKETSIISLYFDTKDELEKVKSQIEKILINSTDIIPASSYKIISGEMEENDWTTVWKKFFHTKHIGKNIVIKPPWEKYKKSKNDIIIEIDPELSFGTGLHGTTRACLEFIEEIADEGKNKTFLDIGTGSGVLSIAAAKMGFAKIDAFDNQQNSLIATDKNCWLNNVKINLFEAELGKIVFDKKYDVVAANMITSVLLPNIDSIISALKPGGILILSGILENQYPEILEKISNRGLKEIKSKIYDEWKSGLFV
jgi:ribosomal protein L11 methyltransferase